MRGTMQKHDFLETIQRRVVLFDGGMGSMLIAAGLTQREIPEEWVLSKGEKIAGVHAAYLEAGAEIVTTATFGASRLKLRSSEAGRKLDIARVNEKAVEIARKALERSGKKERFIAGDIGPTGLFFPPVGTLKAGEAREAFREQAKALAGAGVDLFIIETMYDLREAVEALRAVKEVSNLPAVVTLTFDHKPRGFFTMMGDTTDKTIETLLEEGASVIGANCTLQSGDMIELAEEFRFLTEAPLAFQPNAGRPVMEHGVAVYKQRPKEFAADAVKIVAAGANAVGGCCGTTPEFIREVHATLIHGK
jgi:5-methyltetrahydrofolate--homocysteine methyltransferase